MLDRFLGVLRCYPNAPTNMIVLYNSHKSTLIYPEQNFIFLRSFYNLELKFVSLDLKIDCLHADARSRNAVCSKEDREVVIFLLV